MESITSAEATEGSSLRWLFYSVPVSAEGPGMGPTCGPAGLGPPVLRSSKAPS